MNNSAWDFTLHNLWILIGMIDSEKAGDENGMKTKYCLKRYSNLT
jgi:hypothetical protein